MFSTDKDLLTRILDNVEDQKIQLPDFQRGWVWDDDHIRSLLASISRAFPIGAVMTLSSGGDVRFKTRPIEGVASNGNIQPDFFLLDGQQRLTSLYQSLRHPGPVDTNNSNGQRIRRWYYVDMRAALDPTADREDAIISVPENRRETRDLGRKTVRDLSTPELEYQSHMMPTERIMEPMDWMMGYCNHWDHAETPHPSGRALDFFKEFQKEVGENFSKYQLPIINLMSATPKEAVCTVFEKVNTGGVNLSVFELTTATFAASAESFSLRDDWEQRRERMYSFSGTLQGIQGDQFLKAVSLLKTQEDRRNAVSQGKPATQVPGIGCKKKDILNLELEDYLHWADRVEDGFMEAAKFMQHQFIFGLHNVPYTTQLVSMSAMYVELGDELNSAIAVSRLESWFWSGIFGEVYGGAPDTQLAQDLPQVAEYIRNGTVPILVEQASLTPERLMNLRNRSRAAYKGMYALQMKNHTGDWMNGSPMSIANFHEENIDIHHIFPKRWCQSANPKIPARLYDSVINKTPIDASTNRTIGGQAPSQYLPKLHRKIKPEMLEQVLRSHWLDPKDLEQDDFARSFVKRGEAMLDLIGRAMGKSLGNGREAFENALRSAGMIAGPATQSDSDGTTQEQYDDGPEYDELGEAAYQDERKAADD